ncbi:MAG: NAD(P)-dependent oxidoreductase [Chloroflexi bacterium]|nr:NAD(P)-dependent oxidoreductase [Chloroflexota bacterium]
MTIRKALVSGADGKIGRVTVSELIDHGYDVTPADKQGTQHLDTQLVDFEDLGQVIGVMRGHDAVIHLAAIPSPSAHTAEVVFRNNVISTFNVLEAAAILAIKHVVLASSISALGYAFRYRHFVPVYVPIDEAHPMLSQDCYGLSKMVGETLAEGYLRRMPEMSLTSLRFTTVVDDEAQGWLKAARGGPTRDDELYGAFWTFVDVRDAASACRLALEYTRPGHEAYNICAPSTYREEDTRDLLARHFSGDYPVAGELQGRASPVDPGKAERLLGWKARYDWDRSAL